MKVPRDEIVCAIAGSIALCSLVTPECGHLRGCRHIRRPLLKEAKEDYLPELGCQLRSIIEDRRRMAVPQILYGPIIR